MKVYENEELVKYKKYNIEMQDSWNERDFVKAVKKYASLQTEKVLAVGGLRGTGKTVGILQALPNDDTCYILCQKGETESGVDYIQVLKNSGKKNIVIDEYTWIKDRKELDKYLITAVQNGKRVIITGTESIALDFLKYGTINHRVDNIHTTMFTYDEYCRVFDKPINVNSCLEYLKTGGLFEDYIIDNYASMKNYIEEAIIENLSNYMGNEITETQSKTLVYSVLYDAICKSNISKVPLLTENKLTLDNFLDKMGIDRDFTNFDTYLPRVADVLEHAGIIIKIKNIDENSSLKKQYYLVNPSISYQLTLAAYDIKEVPKKDMGYMFEASAMVQLYTNKLSEQDIYFYDNEKSPNRDKNEQLDIILMDKEKEFAYLFECKLREQPKLEPSNTIMTGHLEKTLLKNTEICGRYVIYNGRPEVKQWDVGTIIFTPLNNIIDRYFEFETNIEAINNSAEKVKKNINADNDIVASSTLSGKSLQFTKDSLKSDLAEKKASEKDAPVKPGHEKNQNQSI